MTEEQLERAARALCEMRGINPDERVPHGPPPGPGGMVTANLIFSPAWRLAAGEVLQFWNMAKAIDTALRGELP